MPEEVSDKTPFIKPVKPTGRHPDHLYSVGSEHIVRREPLSNKPDRKPDLHSIDILRPVLEELQRDYDLAVVPYDVVLGASDKDQPTIFVISDRIEGESISEAKIDKKAGLDFFNSLLDYHIDKFEQGGWYVYDLNTEDFMFGSTKSNPEKRIYFVDLDPNYDFLVLDEPKSSEHFANNLVELSSILKQLKKNSDDDYSPAEEKYFRFLSHARNALPKDFQKEFDEILPPYKDPVEDKELDLQKTPGN